MTAAEPYDGPYVRVHRPGMPDLVMTAAEWRAFQREQPKPVPAPLNRAQRRAAAHRERRTAAGGAS